MVRKKVVCIALAGAVAAAGGVFLGWKVTEVPLSQTAALFSMKPAQPEAPAPLAQSDKPALAEKSEGRMDPTSGEASADADRPLFRLDTPSTKMNVDPEHGKASLDTPFGSISMDTQKREARLDAGRLYLGIGW